MAPLPPRSPAEYRALGPGRFLLDPEDRIGLGTFLRRLGFLDAGESIVEAGSAGEGNMNCTVRVRTTRRSFVLKQSRPWVERYPQFAAPWDRALKEKEFYELIAPFPQVAGVMPRLLATDIESRLLVLEDLGAGGDYTDVYRGGALSPSELDALAHYLTALHTAFAGQPARPELTNREMRALNHAHVFTIPLAPDNGLDLERIEPGLTETAAALKKDPDYVATVTRLGQEAYLADGPCLLHGDFFPGSFVRTAGGPRVLDPEFGFFGRPEWDAGVLLAHLWLAGQPDAARDRVLAGYQPPPGFDPRLMRQLAGVEIMRRLIGYAQLPLGAGSSRPSRAALLQLSRRLVLDPLSSNP